jgi:hypothetical protein
MASSATKNTLFSPVNKKNLCISVTKPLGFRGQVVNVSAFEILTIDVGSS